MTWNYRVLYHKHAQPEPYHALHEVFYDDNGRPNSYTRDPIDVTAESEQELLRTLARMLGDARRRPALVVGPDGKFE